MSSFACVKRLQIIVFGEKFDFPFIPRFYQEKYIFAASLFAYNEISYWIENIYIYIFLSSLFRRRFFENIGDASSVDRFFIRGCQVHIIATTNR